MSGQGWSLRVSTVKTQIFCPQRFPLALARSLPAAPDRSWGPALSLSNTFAGFLRSCSDEVSEESSVYLAETLEGFRCRPRCLASPYLRCCRLAVRCQPRCRELYFHPHSRGCGLPKSMRNPSARRGGAFRGAELRRTRRATGPVSLFSFKRSSSPLFPSVAGESRL